MLLNYFFFNHLITQVQKLQYFILSSELASIFIYLFGFSLQPSSLSPKSLNFWVKSGLNFNLYKKNLLFLLKLDINIMFGSKKKFA